MSDSVSNHPRSTTTRRALIGGLTLGAAAVVAETVRPSSAHAATGDPVIAGADNRAGNLTRLTNTADLSSTDPGHALYVEGASVDGSAIIARNYGRTDPAIEATGGQNHGVSGETFNDSYSGVLGSILLSAMGSLAELAGKSRAAFTGSTPAATGSTARPTIRSVPESTGRTTVARGLAAIPPVRTPAASTGRMTVAASGWPASVTVPVARACMGMR